MAQQIRSAQQKAALQGQAPPAWAIGAKCQALDPLEATWQEATVKGISATGNFVLAFAGREDDLEEVLHTATLSPCCICNISCKDLPWYEAAEPA